MDEETKLDALYEALTLERVVDEPSTPMFSHFGGNPRYWNWWGSPWPVHPSRSGKHIKDVIYYNTEGSYHKIYGPAYVSKMFDIEAWYRNGLLHREGGPAYRHKKSFAWFYDGKLHNLEGPAVIEPAGPKQYWIHGIKFSEKQYKWEIKRRKRKGLL